MNRPLSHILRQASEVMAAHHQSHPLQPSLDLPDYQRTFELVQQLFPSWVLMLYSIQHRAVSHVSENCREVFGYSSAQICRMSLEEYAVHVHPDDREPLCHLIAYMLRLFKIIQPEEALSYRLILHYRFRRANGEYFYLHDEKLAVRDQLGGNVYLMLCKDLSTEKSFSHVRLDVLKLTNNTYQKIKEYVPVVPQQTITRREREIVQLIKDGRSNKEIARQLFISENTARNHRSHLFEKAKARNVVELLNYAKFMQWI